MVGDWLTQNNYVIQDFGHYCTTYSGANIASQLKDSFTLNKKENEQHDRNEQEGWNDSKYIICNRIFDPLINYVQALFGVKICWWESYRTWNTTRSQQIGSLSSKSTILSPLFWFC